MGSTVVLSSEHGEQQKSESKLVNVVAEGIRFRPEVRAEDEDWENEGILDDCRIQEVRKPWRFALASRSRDWSASEKSSGSGVVQVEDIWILGVLVPDSSSSSGSKGRLWSSRSSGSSWMELSD